MNESSTESDSDQRPPTIAIWGSYNGGSVGDTLILLGILSSIGRVYGPSCHVNFLSMGLPEAELRRELALLDSDLPSLACVPVRPERFLPRALVALAGKTGRRGSKSSQSLAVAGYRRSLDVDRIRQVLADSDLLLIGGGNLLMDLFPAWPHFMDIVTEQAEQVGCPVVVFGVGAGPIDTSPGRQMLATALGRTRAALLRDNRSKELVETSLRPAGNLDVGPDAALGLAYPESADAGREARSIGVNIAGVFGAGWPYTDEQKRANYVSSYARIVAAMCAKHETKRVLFLTTNASDRAAEEELASQLASADAAYECTYLDGRSPAELLDEAGQCHVVLATRLHATLGALIAGRPVTAVSYQPKVTDVLATSGLAVNVLAIEDLADDITPARAHQIADAPVVANPASRMAELREAVDGDLARVTTPRG